MQKLHLYFLKNSSMLLFLAVLGLRCCVGFSVVVASRGYSRCGAQALAALPSGCTSYAPRLSSCSTRASLLCSTWDLPGSRVEPVFPALQADSLPLSHQGSLHLDIMSMVLIFIYFCNVLTLL